MKKLLFLIPFLLFATLPTNASHLYGGEISWRCLANGQYIFSMSVYRDCSGINFQFQNETLSIIGSPLPVGSTGGAVSSIVLIPDQNTFQNSNNGDTSPGCTNLYGQAFTCADGQNGPIQTFTYNSPPVTLGGVPPGNGWKFFWEAPCCWANDIENVNTNGSMLLQAIMYPFNGQSADPCFDSSPRFRALPTTLICRENEFTYNQTAIDNDLDSLIYRWGRPFNPPINNPQALTYRAGYSPTNPTPDQNFNSNNIPSTLDPLSGVTDMAVFSGAGIRKYLVVIQVDAYRESQRISSVFREIPISVFDCPVLPNGLVNAVPRVNINGKPTNSTITDIVAGQTVSIPVQVVDNDLTGIAPFLQTLTMVPDGALFTQSRGENSPCIISSPNVEPCAYLRNADPFVDVTATPPVPVLKGLGAITTEFVWQTDCKHIKTRTGFPGTNQGIYNFVMRVQDDHCPIPAQTSATITIRVSDAIPLEEPIMKGISVNLDGSVAYSWAPPIDSASQFNPPVRETDHYKSEKSSPIAGTSATFWSSLDNNILNYKQEKGTVDLPVYNLNVLTDPNSGYNILSPAGNAFGVSFDNYVRMRTFSGCTDTNASIYSEPVQIMRLEATGVGVFPDHPGTRIALKWNSPKRPGSKTHNYYRYESPTHYYIYANDSIVNGGVADSANWYLVGNTSDTSFETSAGNCFNYSAFRVEAKDTVVTWKEGSSIRTDSLDTLYFSTFSMIDTVFNVGGNPMVLNIQNQHLQSSIGRTSYQWTDCTTGQIFLAETLKTFIPSVPGFYKVEAINPTCAAESPCFEVKPIKDSIYTVGSNYLKLSSNGSVVNWVNCADSSIVDGPNAIFTPIQSGSYAAIVGRFGFQKYSDCYTVLPINNTVTQQAFDYFEGVDSTTSYQWFEEIGQADMLLVNQNGKTFIPQNPGKYFVSLSKYAYSLNSLEVIAPVLDKSVNIISNQELQSADTGKVYQWLNCNTGLPIVGETNQNLVLTDTGRYAVVVKAFGYTDTSDCIVMKAVGLPENLFQSQLNYYPNPTNGIVQIEFTDKQSDIGVEVYSIQGKLVQMESFTNKKSFELNLNQTSGIYFIQLTNEKGERANLKVVKN